MVNITDSQGLFVLAERRSWSFKIRSLAAGSTENRGLKILDQVQDYWRKEFK